jgi:hypothetical protein
MDMSEKEWDFDLNSFLQGLLANGGKKGEGVAATNVRVSVDGECQMDEDFEALVFVGIVKGTFDDGDMGTSARMSRIVMGNFDDARTKCIVLETLRMLAQNVIDG